MDPNECPECVDDGIHTNGDICGDYVLDTPADNNVNGRVDPNSCNFLGSDIDPCTNLNYNPSPVNIMSYTVPGCMKEFTLMQGKRMKSLIVLDPGLSSRLLQPGSNTITHVYSDAQIDISQTLPGDIVVHTGAQLTILDCTIKLPWKSKIIVERGAVLLTSNAILTKACGAPDWQGIHVEGNAAIEQPEVYDVPTFDQAGIVIIANNSTVEWARTAISTSKPDGYYGEYFGGLIYATNSQFLYNRRVAEFMKYDKVNKSVFDNCVLDGKNRFNTVGVTIWDCDNILFTFNDIQNMKIGGIYTIDGSAVVRNANNFSNCGDGIYSMATYPASGIMVVEGIGSNRNIFNNNLRHIRVSNNGPYNDLLIKNNDFNMAPGRGIEIIGPSFFRIEENNFASHQTGIYVADCGAMIGFNFNWIWMNNFTNSLYGINAISENRNMQFICNTFNCRYDFYNIAGNSPAAVRVEQGTEIDPANNCFSTQGGNLFDIHSRGTALPFDYYTYLQNCKVPTKQGNYTNVIVGVKDCRSRQLNNQEINLENLLAIRDLIEQIVEEGNPELADSLDRLQVTENYIENALIKQDVRAANFNHLDSVLMGEDTVRQILVQFSAHLTNDLFSNANAYLQQLPDTFPYNEFKQIQAINIYRLQNHNNNSLSLSDSILLSDIAYSNSPNRGFARSLMYLFRSLDILEPEVPEPDPLEEEEFLTRFKRNENSDIEVYPNPTHDILHVSIIGQTNDNLNYRIFDMQGIVRLQGHIADLEMKTISLRELGLGLYYIQIIAPDPAFQKIHKIIIK